MAKIFFLIFLLFPFLAQGAAGIVNNQQTYAVPLGAAKVLILDLTLPAIPQSIKITNAGTAQQTDISKISVYEDGLSSGWDGDEKEIVWQSNSPFFGVKLIGDFSQKRIFVTVDIASNAVSERTIQPKAQIDSSAEEIIGLERKILAGSSQPTVPVAPLAQQGEALSTSTIRWKFLDLANNEFGFKILDSRLKAVARIETADLSYLDETGLTPSTCYSGRRAAAFNDRGESNYSAIFSEVCTLSQPVVEVVIEEAPEEATVTEAVAEPLPLEKETPKELSPVEKLRAQIEELQLKIIELLKQLIQLLSQQLAKVWIFLASLWFH